MVLHSFFLSVQGPLLVATDKTFKDQFYGKEERVSVRGLGFIGFASLALTPCGKQRVIPIYFLNCKKVDPLKCIFFFKL